MAIRNTLAPSSIVEEVKRRGREARTGFTSADSMLITASIILILFVLVVVPILFTLAYSFAPVFPLDERGLYALTGEHYGTLLADTGLFFDITFTSIYFSVGATVFGISIGLAAAIAEFKYLGSSPFRYLVLLPYAIPSVVGVTAWLLLIGPNGWIIQFLEWVGLPPPPVDIYSMYGMIFVEGLHIVPIAFLLLAPAVRSVPQAMDESAMAAGASRLQIFRKIIFPMIYPAILSIGIYLFARNLSVVTVPSVLGLPDRLFTWGSAIPFLFLYGGNLNYGTALAFSVLIIIFSGVLMVFYYKSVSEGEKYTTVTGVGQSEAKVYDVSRWKRGLAMAFLATYVFIGGVLPMSVVVWDSVMQPFLFTVDPSALTLERYVDMLDGATRNVPYFGRALTNTILLGVAVPTFSMIVSYLISYSNQAINSPLSGFMAWLASVPLTIPGISVGLAFLAVFITTPLYGSILVIVIAMLAKNVPKGMRYSSPGIIKVGKENFEMAQVCGARDLRILKQVMVPLTSRDFLAGWMQIYVHSVRTVTIPILLFATGSEVIGVELLFRLINGDYKVASTFGVVLIVLSTIPYMILQYYRISSE